MISLQPLKLGGNSKRSTISAKQGGRKLREEARKLDKHVTNSLPLNTLQFDEAMVALAKVLGGVRGEWESRTIVSFQPLQLTPERWRISMPEILRRSGKRS